MTEVQGFFLAGLVLVHLFASRLRVLDSTPRSRWLSLSGGISVAYVFMHVFPELAEAQHTIGAQSAWIPWVENHAYLVALTGLAVFYGLERLVKLSKQQQALVLDQPAKNANSAPTAASLICVARPSSHPATIAAASIHRPIRA